MPKKLSAFQEYIIVTIVSSGVFASVLSTSMLVLAFSAISESFAVNFHTFHWRNIVFFAFFALNLPLCGSLCKKIGARKQFFLGLSFFVLATFTTAFTKNWVVFLSFQSLQAFADSMIVATMPVLIRNFIPENRLGWAFGLELSILAGAGVIGGPLGGLILNYTSWKWLFILLGCLAILIISVASYALPKLDAEIIEKDTRLPILSTVCLMFLLLSFQVLINTNYHYLGYLGAILSFLLLIFSERHGKASIFPKNLFKNKDFCFGVVRTFCIATATHMVTLFLPSYLIKNFMVPILLLSWFIIIESLISVIFSTYFGKMADRRPIAVLYAGFVSLAAAMVSVMILSYYFSYFMVIMIYLLVGTATALISPSQMKIVVQAIPKEQTSSYMGIYYLCYFMCGGLASLLFMRISPRNLEHFENFMLVGVLIIAFSFLTFLPIKLSSRKE